MNPSEIIAEVAKLGVVLRVEGTNLVHRGPRGALRPELIAKLKAHKPAIVAELTSAEAPRALCPADVAERSAIIAEGDGCDRSEADERALGAHRFPSWSALADAQRAEILANLERLPPSCERDGERLLQMTRAFLESSYSRRRIVRAPLCRRPAVNQSEAPGQIDVPHAAFRHTYARRRAYHGVLLMRKKVRQRLLRLFPECITDPRLRPPARLAQPKREHGKCGSQTRRKTPCQRKALANGRCANHGGLSSGPKTPDGRRRISEVQRARWQRWRAERGR